METIFILTNEGKLTNYPAFRSRADAGGFLFGLGSLGAGCVVKEVVLWPLKTADEGRIDLDLSQSTSFVFVTEQLYSVEVDPILNKLDDDGETH